MRRMHALFALFFTFFFGTASAMYNQVDVIHGEQPNEAKELFDCLRQACAAVPRMAREKALDLVQAAFVTTLYYGIRTCQAIKFIFDEDYNPNAGDDGYGSDPFADEDWDDKEV